MGVNIGGTPKKFNPPGAAKPSKVTPPMPPVQTILPGDTVTTGPAPLPKETAAAMGASFTPPPKAELTVVTKPVKDEAKPNTKPTKLSESAALTAAIVKEKGDKIVFRGRDIPDVTRLPTGDFEFDFSTGGGFPRGRFSLIYGPESSCKTTMALRAAGIAQRGPAECNKAVFIDVEHSFDADRAEELGVDVDELIVVKPAFGEEAADLAVAYLYAADIAIVIFDSIAALISTAEIDKSLEKFDVGTSAILIKRMTNKMNIALAVEAKRDHYPALILINQIRYKVGVMFGNPETTPGGKNPHFLSALTLRVQGKNKTVKDVNPDKPSFKELEFNVIKAKIGIIRSHFEMDLCMVAHGDLLAGETASWGLVKNELQAAGLLTAVKGGWQLEGIVYKTQKMIEDTYYAEADFSLHLQQLVIQNYSGKKTVFDDTKKFIASTGDQPADLEPGEIPNTMLFQGKK